jgi:hypothetical protein
VQAVARGGGQQHAAAQADRCRQQQPAGQIVMLAPSTGASVTWAARFGRRYGRNGAFS